MIEQETKKSGRKWHKVDIGNGHFIDVKTIDPEIMAQMPKTVKLFWEISPFETLMEDINRLFKIRG